MGAGLASDGDAKTIGAYYADLLGDGSWIRRRVETVEFLDDHRIERRVTLDVNGDDLRSRADLHGLETLHILPVPLATLNKELQFDVDVRDMRDEPIPVTLSDEDSHIAHAFALSIISDTVTLNTLSDALRKELFRLIRRPSVVRLAELARRVSIPSHAANPEIDIDLSDDDKLVWRSLFDSDITRQLLVQLSQSYVFAAQITPLPGTFIVKFRYVEEWRPSPRWRLGEQLGYQAAKLFVPAYAIGSAQREHTRIAVPDGTKISRTRLVQRVRRRDRSRSRWDRPVSQDMYGSRQSPERAVIYTRGIPRGQYGVAVRVRPQLGLFFIPAFLSTAFIGFLMWAGDYLESHSMRFTNNPGIAEAAVAVIILVPSAIAIYFVRAGEHLMVARHHVVPRVLVLLSAMDTVAVAAAVAAHMSHAHLDFMFAEAFAFSAGVAIYLLSVILTILIATARHPKATFPTGPLDHWAPSPKPSPSPE